MQKLNDNELKQITGGAIHFGAIAGIFAGVTFLIGLVDGLIKLK